VVDAVQCAVAIQNELQTHNAELPENRRMEFRIGINLGDVIDEEDRLYGDGVNIAARLEALADAGGVCISGTAFDQVKGKLSLGYRFVGEQTVKNIPDPIRVYKVLMDERDAGKLIGPEKKTRKSRWAEIAAIVVFVAIGTVIYQFYVRSPAIEPAAVEKMAFPLPEKPSIAVLPFDNMSGDPNQDYLSDGMTEEIITALSKVPYLFVIARNSTFSYKGKPVKISQVAEELGVRYVLEGSVRIDGDRVRVTAQLIDAIKGHHLWAERYERELEDTFALQDEITGSILSALAVKLTKGEQATTRRKVSDNLEANLKALQAFWYLRRDTKEGHIMARQLAEEAMALDPEYARPYLIMSAYHVRDVHFGWSKSRKESLKRAFELAQKAISLDDSYPECYVMLSSIYMFKKQYEGAIAEAERAITLDPNGADAYSMLGTVLHMVGRPQEAIAPLEKAIRINPMAPSIYYRRLGGAYRDIGRYEEAIVLFKKAINLTPDSLYPHVGLTVTYSLAGRDEEANFEASEILRIQPKFSLDSFVKRVAFKHKADIDRIVGALRKAGLPEHPPLPLPDKPSIAVLAFDNLSGDPEQEYFSDGISEEIISALSKTDQLFVIARNSSFTYKGKPVNVKQVARELGVRYVLEGSVRKSADRVRITAQLIDATAGHHLWSERYDRELKDIFAVQDEITMKIITALQVELTEGEQMRMWATRYRSLDVQLKAMELLSLWRIGTVESIMRHGQISQELIDEEPELPVGYRALGWHHYWLASAGKSPRENFKKAFDLAQKAISLDESDGMSHGLLGSLYQRMRQYEKAITIGKRSIELDPNGAQVHLLLGQTLHYAGRPDDAIVYLNKAIRLNPFPPYMYPRALGNCYLQKGEYEKALIEFKKAVQRSPKMVLNHVHLAVAYSLLSREEEARASAAKAVELFPPASIELFSKTQPYKNQADLKLRIDALRKAGFPEKPSKL
jgi:adenylate cyclase